MRISAKAAAIEIVGDDVRVAVVKTSGRLPRVLELHSARAVYAEEGERHSALVAAVREAVGAVKSRPAVYSLCASSAWSVVRLLKIPFRGRRRVAAAVQFELEPFLAFPIEELVVDFLPVREVDGETEVLAVGTRRAALEEQMEILEEAGVRVEGIGLDAVGLTELWQARRRGDAGLDAVLHVRESGAILAVVWDKKLVYVRHVALSAAGVCESPGAAAREVQNVLRAFVASWEVEEEVASLSVTGVRLFEEERSLFEDEFDVEVRYEDLVADLKGGAGKGAGEERDWAACIAVASSSAGDLFSLDFLQEGLGSSGLARGVVGHAVVACCLGFLALASYVGYCYVDYRNNLAATERLGQETWEVCAETFPNSELAKGRPAGDIGAFRTFEMMAEEVEKESRAGKALSVEMFSKEALLDILLELAEKMPNSKVSITGLRISVGKMTQISVSGEVKNSDVFADVLADLKRSVVFNVDPDRMKRSSKGGVETFVITATL